MTRPRVLVVGAGICGMTAGHELAEAGFDVTIVEIEPRIGGLAKTYRYDGFSFDSGPHVFLTANPEVNSFVTKVMQDDLRAVPMRGAVHFLGRYYDWPLTPQVVLGFPPRVALAVARDAFVRIFHQRRVTPVNFEEYVLQKYGRTLYELDFRPYTEKFTKLPATEIHPDWAILGVSRTVVSEAVKTASVGQVIRMALGPRPATRLLYPRRGISSFHARLADSITKRGGRILLESRVERFRADGGKIVGARIAPSGHDEPCDFVVWTGPLPEVCGLLGVQKPDLQYLSIVVFNISLRGKPRRDYQWIYYVDRNLPFNRVYNTSLFSAENAPPDHYGLCAEVSCRVDDEAWRDACSREDDVVSALESVALINREDVLAVHHEKLASAYPLYRINYREHQERGTLALAGFANLIVAGRTGRFWYNTMDQSIANALDVASQVREHLRESEPRKRGE